MNRVQVAAAALTLVLTAVSGTIVSAAVEWRTEVPIARSEMGGPVADASYRDKLTVIGWQVADDADRVLRLALSRDAGRGAFAKRVVADDVDGMAVAACEEGALVAYRERQDDGGTRLRLARVPFDGGSIERITIRRPIALKGSLDLACGSGWATVTWTGRVGSAWHAFARHVRLTDLKRSTVTDLGVAFVTRDGRVATVAAAASGDRAYVAWLDPTGLRLQRFIVGAGPAFAIKERPTQRLTDYGGLVPAMAADGARVAVGYAENADPEVLVSLDRGATFQYVYGYGLDPGDGAFLSLGIEGRRAVGTVEFRYLQNAYVHRLASEDLAGHWGFKSVSSTVVRPLDGLLTTGTGVKLAETFSRKQAEGDGWDLVFRRER